FHATSSPLIYTLSLHDALPIYFTFEWKDIFEIRPRYSVRFTNNKYNLDTFEDTQFLFHQLRVRTVWYLPKNFEWRNDIENNYDRSEEHTSELQSRENLVCRLLL